MGYISFIVWPIVNNLYDSEVLADIEVCKERLKNIPQSKGDGQISKNPTTDPEHMEDEERLCHEENARIVQEAYDFEKNPIFIPENLKNRKIDNLVDEPSSKKPKMDCEPSKDEYLDTETMMKDFVFEMKSWWNHE